MPCGGFWSPRSDTVEADDCFQETFVAALRAYPRLRADSNLRAWVLTIAHRKASTLIAAARAAPFRWPSRTSSTRARRQRSRCAIEALWDAVGELPARQRSAVVLRYVADLPHRDIASRDRMLGGGGAPVSARGTDQIKKGGAGMSSHATNEHESIEDALRRASGPHSSGTDEAARSARELSARRPAPPPGAWPRRSRPRVGRRELCNGGFAVRYAASRHHRAWPRARGLSRGGRRLGAGATRPAESRRGSSRRRRRWRRRGGSSMSTSPGAGVSSSWTRLDARGPLRPPRAAGDRRDPLRRRAELWRGRCRRGLPRGSRAAGNALGSNPIPIVIPCHRVLRAGGALGGYGGGR